MKRLLRSKTPTALFVLLAGTVLACAGAAPDAETERTQADAATAADTATVAQNESADVSCEMAFTMEGWSAIVSKAEGEGRVTCDNGQSAEVVLEVTGGGLTVGKTEIDEGSGTFSDVEDISEIFGSYAQAEASAGAVDEAVSAQALTKGEVSLAITTKGRGWSLGVSGARFTIERATDSGATGMDT